MIYSFSNNPDSLQSGVFSPATSRVTTSSRSTNQYYGDPEVRSSALMEDTLRKQRNVQLGPEEPVLLHSHKDILVKDLREMLARTVRETKARFTRELESHFDQLSREAQSYVLSNDLCSLLEVKYKNSDPHNLIPIIKYEFGSLLPQFVSSLSGFTENLRAVAKLDVVGKGNFTYQKKTISQPIYSNDFKLGYPSAEQIRYALDREASRQRQFTKNGSKTTSRGFGQIQTGHFEPSNVHHEYFTGVSRDSDAKAKCMSQLGNRQPLVQCNVKKFQNTGPMSQQDIKDMFKKLDVDKQTREKIQSVLGQHSLIIRDTHKTSGYGENSENPVRGKPYQYITPPGSKGSQYQTWQPDGHTYHFSKTTYQ